MLHTGLSYLLSSLPTHTAIRTYDPLFVHVFARVYATSFCYVESVTLIDLSSEKTVAPDARQHIFCLQNIQQNCVVYMPFKHHYERLVFTIRLTEIDAAARLYDNTE